MTRAIITVVGKDTVGIIAKVCTYLADNQINILDISQTIVQEFFNMMMIVDLTKSVKAFNQLSDELATLGEDTGVQVKCQLEDIFDKMHRIFENSKTENAMINLQEVIETNKMIEQENLDVRTITMGISLLDCADKDLTVTCEKIYQKITTLARDLGADG